MFRNSSYRFPFIICAALLLTACGEQRSTPPETQTPVQIKSETRADNVVQEPRTAEEPDRVDAEKAETTDRADLNKIYVGILETGGISLEAQMSGELKVENGCLVFTTGGDDASTAIFIQPARLTFDDGEPAGVEVGEHTLSLGETFVAGGGQLSSSRDWTEQLQQNIPENCPRKSVQIGEIVK